jgi:hypothetical protein
MLKDLKLDTSACRRLGAIQRRCIAMLELAAGGVGIAHCAACPKLVR